MRHYASNNDSLQQSQMRLDTLDSQKTLSKVGSLRTLGGIKLSDYRSPLGRAEKKTSQKGTFSRSGMAGSLGRFSVNSYEPDNAKYFRGRDAPAVGSYNPKPVFGVLGSGTLYESKTMTRGIRGHIFVNKH